MTQAIYSSTKARQAAPPSRAPMRWGRLGWQLAELLYPAGAARALEQAWFRPPHGNGPEGAGRELLERARTDWALVTGQGTSRRVRVYRWGSTGPTVLLAHGWGGHAAQWQPLVAPLLTAGMRVVAFDALSHGGSDAGAHGASQTSVVEMSRALLATAWHAGPIHAVIAHSLGSAALALAVREGLHLQAAVMIGPPADMHKAAAALAWQLGIGPGVLARMQRNSERWLGMPWSAFNVPAIGIGHARPVPPTLVIHDRQDKEVGWENGAAIAGAWPGAQLMSTDGLGHRRILHDAQVIARAVSFVGGAARMPGIAEATRRMQAEAHA
ncbi:alpha/beta fold hydrolase [Cupriavidus sp. CuC1]|uniref:alpha/beta fold hydrolase n=1 Tax=Cupriavidus sp. CuC1 TaxID=3373131 RepID=UPI0037D11206